MNEMKLYDIYEHWHIPFWQTRWFFWLTISLFVFVISLVLAWLLNKYFSKRTLSPHLQALRDLEQLKKRVIANREEAQDAYFALTGILKKFFHAHYKKSFVGMSDREMIEALKNSSTHQEENQKLEAVVNESAMIKYARHDALQNNFLHAVSVSIQLINSIKAPDKHSR